MPIYLAGEIVLVPVIVAEEPDDDGLYPVTVPGTEAALQLPLASLAVQRGIPADGEPVAGQLWTDQYGLERLAIGEMALLVDASGRTSAWHDLHDGPAGPIRLVREAPPIAEPPDGPAPCPRCREVHPVLGGEERSDV